MLLHSGLHFPNAVALLFSVTLVVLFFTLGQADFAFDASSEIVKVDRHQGIAGTFDFADQLVDFRRMEQ